MISIKVLTLFPGLFPGPLGVSVTGKALKNKLWELDAINIRDFALDAHKSVDDSPAGGGTGMVMKPDVMSRAIDHAVGSQRQNIFYLSPRGKVLTQGKLHELAKLQRFVLICGRFEGVDQRVIDHYNIEEISIGNYVLTGGEMAAYVVIDGCIRLVPGVLGNEGSNLEESFAVNSEYQNLVEYPQYTKPNVWHGYKIPDVLTSGDHQKVKKWRLEQARSLTKRLRPDLA